MGKRENLESGRYWFSRPPHSTTLPPLHQRTSSTVSSTFDNISASKYSPAVLLSPNVLTRRKQYRPSAATVRRLVLQRVGEHLYRSDAQIYYAVLKIKGKQVRRSLGTTDKSIARKKLVELRRQSSRLTPAAITFENLTQQYLDFIGARGMKPASYKRRVVAVRSLGSYFGGKPVRNITRLNIERWAASRTQDVSARTYNIELETLKQIFSYAVEHDLIVENPAAALRRQKQKAAQVVIPSREQFRVLIADLRLGKQSKETADFVEFLAYSGCRQGETSEVRLGRGWLTKVSNRSQPARRLIETTCLMGNGVSSLRMSDAVTSSTTYSSNKAATKCSSPLVHRCTVPCQVPAFSAGVLWMMKNAAESSHINAVNPARILTKEIEARGRSSTTLTGIGT